GDACIVDGAPIQLPEAAGPVGHGNTDDFDQDGLANGEDACPRIRVERVECASADDCPADAKCTGGICNHVDSDNDGVGDLCDTCPQAPNGSQVQDGGMQLDDPDQDFVGNACETNPSCYERPDARRIA